MNNKFYTLIKPSAVLGAIAGLAFGIITLIPFVQCITCFTFALIGAAVVVYLKKNAFVGILTYQDGALIGGVAGFVAIIAGSVVYLPIEVLLNMFSKFNLFNSIITVGYSFIVIPLIALFLAIMSAVFNAFTGLIAAYIYEKLENIPAPEDEGIDIIQ